MKAEYKQPWIDALRSGNFKQTCSYLCLDDTYCCLGVLCKINGKLTHNARGVSYYIDEDGASRQGSLSPAMKEVFGIDDSQHDKLTSMNDKEGKSFEEIAQYIEENL